MKTLAKIISTALFSGVLVFALSTVSHADAPAPAAAPEKKAKNWTPPAYKNQAQALSDQIMSAHPELLSVTFHGVPPGMKDTYTMFAGSYPDRIGNPDDPDDIDVQKLGVTTVDPRWHRTKDTVKKFVMMMPLRDASSQNIGLLVLAYKLDPAKNEKDYFNAAVDLRNGLQKQIPSYSWLYDRAK